jgi:hypothetical protein
MRGRECSDCGNTFLTGEVPLSELDRLAVLDSLPVARETLKQFEQNVALRQRKQAEGNGSSVGVLCEAENIITGKAKELATWQRKMLKIRKGKQG